MEEFPPERPPEHASAYPGQNRFYQQAFAADDPDGLNPSKWSGILASFLTVLIFLVLGSIVVGVVLYVIAGDEITKVLGEDDPLGALNLGFLTTFQVNLLPFLIGWLGLFVTNRTVEKRPFQGMVTGYPKIRWMRMLQAGGLTLLVLAAAFGLEYLLSPEGITYRPDWEAFFRFLPWALLLVPMQSAFEEVFIRGQLLQGCVKAAPRMPWIGIFASSLFFALLHSFNPEVLAYGFLPMMAYYFFFGFVLAGIAVLDQGLEISIGIHATNNLISFLFLGYEGGALKTPSVFYQQQVTMWLGVVAIAVLALVIYAVMLRPRLNSEQMAEAFEGPKA